MRVGHRWPLLAFALVGGCVGDGTGLDEFGRPVRTPAGPLAPTLSSIQERIFSPICAAACHTGASAPLGLALDAGVARANLVGVASVEQPAMLRVRPSQPDSSYLIWKLEGRAGITGGRMPLGLAPLTAEELNAIRQWIAAGAPD